MSHTEIEESEKKIIRETTAIPLLIAWYVCFGLVQMNFSFWRKDDPSYCVSGPFGRTSLFQQQLFYKFISNEKEMNANKIQRTKTTWTAFNLVSIRNQVGVFCISVPLWIFSISFINYPSFSRRSSTAMKSLFFLFFSFFELSGILSSCVFCVCVCFGISNE